MIKRYLPLLAMALFAFMAVGCCPITKLGVTVDLDPALRQKLARNMEVDLVVITPSQRDKWQDYSMTRYWDYNDAMRASVAGVTKKMIFDPAKPAAQTLPDNDPLWKTWLAGANDKDAPELYILAQLPGSWEAAKDDAPGNKDKRRLILPLGKCRWDSTNVKVTVQETGMISVPSPKLKK